MPTHGCCWMAPVRLFEWLDPGHSADAAMQLRQQHRQQLQIEELGRLLREALQSVDADHETIANWREQVVSEEMIVEWADEDVRQKWGIKGAVRVLAVVGTGWDAELRGDLKNKRPSEIATDRTVEVPGILPPVADAFGISQALTWIAGQRTDVQDDLEWRSQVPELMQLLLNRASRTKSLFDR